MIQGDTTVAFGLVCLLLVSVLRLVFKKNPALFWMMAARAQAHRNKSALHYLEDVVVDPVIPKRVFSPEMEIQVRSLASWAKQKHLE